MKRYKPLLTNFEERRMLEFKAWYLPSTNKLIQFSVNGLHSEKAEELFKMNEVQAVKHGYYRILLVPTELNIDSWAKPSDREFKALQYSIAENSYHKFKATRWSLYSEKGFIFFPAQSFLFANSINDGKHKVF